MRAPIRHDAVTAVWTISFAAITDNGVIRNSYFWFINHRERWISRLQSPDTVRKTFGASGQLHKFGAGERVRHRTEHLERKPDQTNTQATQSTAGHIASAMRSTNEYNAVDSGICAISQSSHNETIA